MLGGMDRRLKECRIERASMAVPGLTVRGLGWSGLTLVTGDRCTCTTPVWTLAANAKKRQHNDYRAPEVALCNNKSTGLIIVANVARSTSEHRAKNNCLLFGNFAQTQPPPADDSSRLLPPQQAEPRACASSSHRPRRHTQLGAGCTEAPDGKIRR